MKSFSTFALLGLLFALTVGCGGSGSDTTVVGDQDDYAPYLTPAGAAEDAINSSKNAGKAKR